MATGEKESGQAVLQASAATPWRGRGFSRETEFLAAALLLVAGAFVYPYVEGLAGSLMPPCLFHRLTGIPCLLCGMTRSLAATAHGRMGEAFRFHLLGPPLFFLALAVGLTMAAESVLSRRFLPRPGKRAWRYIGCGTLVLLSAAWIARLVFFGNNL
ncbi:MAG: DUF2752 domain-containing protein [Actinomycetota bacterium]